MKGFSFNLILLLSLCVLFGQNVHSSVLPPVEDSNAAVLNSRAIDVYTAQRNTLNNIINSLNNAANAANQFIIDSLVKIQEVRENFLIEVNNIVQNITTEVENAIQAIQVTTQIIADCIRNQQTSSNTLINNLIVDTTACIIAQVDSVTGLLGKGSEIVGNAINLALNTANEVVACGVAGIGNFFQVGICLTDIITKIQTPATQLIAKINGFVAEASSIVVTIPVNLTVCAGTILTSAALRLMDIITSLGQCTINAIG